MKNITKKQIEALAAEYGKDADYLEDIVLDMESEGIRVDATDLEDMLANDDI